MPQPTIDPASENWWERIPLPEGFMWYAFPADNGYGFAAGTIAIDPRRDTSGFPARIAALREWADENGIQLAIIRNTELSVSQLYVSWPIRFAVAQTDAVVFNGYYGEASFPGAVNCPCGEEHPPYTVACPTDGRTLTCVWCGMGPAVRTRNPVTLVESGGDLVCTNCAHPCSVDDCETMTLTSLDYCPEHGQHGSCEVCGNRMEAAAGSDTPWVSTGNYAVLCFNCAEHVCPNCDRYSDNPMTYSGDMDGYVCRRCFREAVAGAGTEDFDNSATVSAAAMRIPSIPGRENVRMCGVEIEGANGSGGGHDLAQAFFGAGLSMDNVMQGYHSGSHGFAKVERDSSVDWEAVIGPLNPAEREDMVMLNRAVRAIRSLVKDGTLSLDLRAGCHIHVEAARASLDGAFNLNTLFAYIEDVIYRLGAAKWPIHRAIGGSDYAQPVPKETRKLQFARTQNDEDGGRYYALSFANYFNRMLSGCHCGAVRYDSWEDCTCDLGKCTFEFRVFNTTANPRKLHAYLALTQALVAKALKMGTIDSPVEEFPALGFVAKRFKDMTSDSQEELLNEWRERITWMFTELPLTDEERESLRYCVRNSELAEVGEDFINELIPAAAEQQVIEEVAA